MDPRKHPTSYRYLITPTPIARTDRVGRFAKDVWSVIYTYERMNGGEEDLRDVHLSKKQIVSLVGSDRKAVRRAFDELVKAGLLERGNPIRSSARQRSYIAVRTKWPPWLGENADDLLLAVERRKLLIVDERGEGQTAPGGEGQTAPGGRGAAPHLDQGDQGEEEGSRGAPPRDPDDDRRDGGGANEPGEEVEEMNLDEESRAAAEALAAERAERVERNRRPRRKRVATPEEVHLREPSRRPEMNRFREKDPSGRDWSARDVVGYFIARYKEVVREEPSEFFATSDAIFRHHGSNVAKYTKRWLEGDYRRARELVEKILSRAVDRGMPLKLGYFFTPAKESTALRLDEDPKPGRTTPAERNDAVGDYDANRDEWDRKRAEFEARQRERRENERGAGEVHQTDEGAE
jgi:hypothetical protein